MVVIKKEKRIKGLDITSFNYGFSIGIGVIIPVPQYDIIIKSMYNHGYNNLYNRGQDIYNHYFRLMIGISTVQYEK